MTANLKVVEPEPDDAELRHVLHVAIEQRDLAQQRRDKSADAVERASQFVARLEDNLAAFADTNERIARSRAEAFKQSLAIGDAMPMLSLSPELAAAAAKQLDAANQLDGARQAYESLSEELTSEQQTLDRLQADVERSARVVVARHADAMARELMALERQAGETRRRLLGVTAMSPRPPFPVAASTVALLRDAPRNSVYGRESAEDTAWWHDWHARLTHDSEAMPDE